jgi:hypothetical protein
MTGSRRRRFVLVDPCLTGLGSHPFHYACEVLGAASRAGFECRLAAHRTFAATGCPPEWLVLPAFTYTAYSKYTACSELDRHGPRAWLPRAPWTQWHAARRREERIAAFARELAPVIQGLSAGDLVLVATASELEVAGLARAIAAAGLPPGVGWHAEFHFPLYRGFAPDFPRQDRRLDRLRDLLRTAIATAADHALHFHTTTEELAAQYARILPGPVGSLPYPAQPPQRADRRGAAPLRVACLGDARPEKNSQCLAALVDSVAADRELAGAVRFAVQTNPGFPAASRKREHVDVRRSLERLAGLAAAGGPVDLIGGPLDEAAYSHELAAADVALLAYDQDRYRVRCSGIILESLAAAAIPIVTGGGWMARQIAGPLREHARLVTTSSRVVNVRRIAAPRMTQARPVVVDVELPPATAGADGQAVIAVDIAWDAAGASCLDEPPVRVGIEGLPTRPPTILAADPDGRPATALFPLAGGAAGGTIRVRLAPACGAAAATPAAITLRHLATPGPVAAGAVGVVIESPAGVAGALREVVRHAAHYRATAAAHAETVRAAATGAEVVRRLLS